MNESCDGAWLGEERWGCIPAHRDTMSKGLEA